MFKAITDFYNRLRAKRHFDRLVGLGSNTKIKDKTLCRIWVKAERIDNRQSEFGETISILLTHPDDEDHVFFKAGPYTIKNNEMITHDHLLVDFQN